ncbi:MAG: protein kinase [Vicinamibacterales bacterium]
MIVPGTRFGPYEILSSLGAGGMGEVYKARDTRLDRIVAIKVLPETLAADPQFRERFDREARAISRLDHPHICVLYDVGEHPSTGSGRGTAYLVMQYLEGETLADRLRKGALPLDQALTYATQMADALAAAHRVGITHRDLKPGNVMLTKAGSKLLDFGLAKTAASAVATTTLSALPTEGPGLTAQGTILGTFQYMAPEQLEGHDAGGRTDIFAFGAVVYEMLTGRKAFEGKSHASLIAAIMHADPPPVSTLQPLTPPALDRIVKKCLAKDPDERWQGAKDLHDELKWIVENAGAASGAPTSRSMNATQAGSRTNRERLAWTVAAVLMLATVALGAAVYLLRLSVDTPTYRVSIVPPEGGSLSAAAPPGNRFALSPDGRRIVFVGTDASGKRRLWVRSLDSLDAQPLAGTEIGDSPFWSPDSRSIAFHDGNKLKRIDASGGSIFTVADVVGGGGGTWGQDDVILFSPTVTSPISRVSASGGTVTPVTTIDASGGDQRHFYPYFLPDGRHFLYLAIGATPRGPRDARAVYVGSLIPSEKPKLLLEGGSNAMYAQGHLLFIRDATLMAQPFDIGRLELTGEAEPLVERIALGGGTGQIGAHAVSTNGVLAYQSDTRDIRSQLTWFDRSGKPLSTVGEITDQMALSMSPGGARATASLLDAAGNRDLWIYDLARGLRTRFTTDPGDEVRAIWSPDGNRIIFSSVRGGTPAVLQKSATGAGPEELLWRADMGAYADDWSPDGRFVLWTSTVANNVQTDLWILPLFGDRRPTSFVQTRFNEGDGRFSPDGRWVAYTSNESSRNEVFVVPFPGAAGKSLVSVAGGSAPRWRRDGKELFYLTLDNRLMAVDVDGQGPDFRVGTSRPLFEIRPRTRAYFRHSAGSAYDVSPDGQRFLVNAAIEETTPTPITLVINWAAALGRP